VEAHRKLDEAVFAMYGWPVTLTDVELLERLLVLNHERAAASQEQRSALQGHSQPLVGSQAGQWAGKRVPPTK
jgi:hypothetical protein